MPIIDLNADIGEGGVADSELIAHATSVNIACGGHAGSEATMRMTIEAAKAAGVAIGAHPGYEDPDNFGRVGMNLSPAQLTNQIKRQIERFLGIHPELHHIKAHGALYNQANVDEAVAATLVDAIMELKPDTILYCPPGGEMAKFALSSGLRTCVEGFIERTYMSCGNLTPRTAQNAIIEDFREAAAQAVRITMTQSLESIDGALIPMPARTLCVHGDNPDAPELLRYCRELLNQAGVEISSP